MWVGTQGVALIEFAMRCTPRHFLLPASLWNSAFQVKATGGDTHLGGEDFDNKLVDWAVAAFEKQHGAGRANKLKANARAIRRLRTACENAKRAVSSAPSTTLEVRAWGNAVTFCRRSVQVSFVRLPAWRTTSSCLFWKRIELVQAELSALFAGKGVVFPTWSVPRRGRLVLFGLARRFLALAVYLCVDLNYWLPLRHAFIDICFRWRAFSMTPTCPSSSLGKPSRRSTTSSSRGEYARQPGSHRKPL